MARVAALIPDLLFGSGVVATLQQAGHEVVLVGDATAVDPASVDVVIVDLTADAPQRIEAGRSLMRRPGLATLGVYAHVEGEVRQLALEAGFDLVVPRSRMAREGPQLVKRLSG